MYKNKRNKRKYKINLNERRFFISCIASIINDEKVLKLPKKPIKKK